MLQSHDRTLERTPSGSIKQLDKALLDTDIVSEIFREINQRVIAKATAYRAVFGCYTISAITVMEVVQGWHKRQRGAKYKFRALFSS